MNVLAIFDPIFMRGLERIIIALGAISFGYLGYKLFRLGHDRGKSTLEFESKFMKIVFSGTGPGLLFMAFGVIVLSTGIVYGGAKVKDDTRILKNMVDQTNDRVMELRKITDKRFMEIANETSIRIDRNREYGLQSLQESYKEPLYRLEDQMTKLKVKIEELEKNRERQ